MVTLITNKGHIMNNVDIWYIHSLEGAISGLALREAELGTISGYTVHIMRMLADKATNKAIQAEAVAWLNDNAEVIEEIGGEA